MRWSRKFSEHREQYFSPRYPSDFHHAAKRFRCRSVERFRRRRVLPAPFAAGRSVQYGHFVQSASGDAGRFCGMLTGLVMLARKSAPARCG